jgi:hypothetical protein
MGQLPLVFAHGDPRHRGDLRPVAIVAADDETPVPRHVGPDGIAPADIV